MLLFLFTIQCNTIQYIYSRLIFIILPSLFIFPSLSFPRYFIAVVECLCVLQNHHPSSSMVIESRLQIFQMVVFFLSFSHFYAALWPVVISIKSYHHRIDQPAYQYFIKRHQQHQQTSKKNVNNIISETFIFSIELPQAPLPTTPSPATHGVLI